MARRSRGRRRRTGIDENFYGNPDNERSTQELDEFDVEELHGDDGHEDAQGYGRARADQASDPPLPGWQGTQRQGDDQGVVAGQQQVDPDDREAADQKMKNGGCRHQMVAGAF